MRCLLLQGLLLLSFTSKLPAQTLPEDGRFSRLNSFGIFGEYSNDSSHMLLGRAEQRKLLGFGASYGRRILLRPAIDLQYMAEYRPLLFESDPVVLITATFTPAMGTPSSFQFTLRQAERCRAGVVLSGTGTEPGGVTYTTTQTANCGGRQWSYAQGVSPAGLKLNLMPRQRVQPILSALGGTLLSSQPIPVSAAGSFNFTFEFGAGLEIYRRGSTGRQSIRAEYRYHHISNKGTATANPGIDSGLFQVTYAFGR